MRIIRKRQTAVLLAIILILSPMLQIIPYTEAYGAGKTVSSDMVSFDTVKASYTSTAEEIPEPAEGGGYESIPEPEPDYDGEQAGEPDGGSGETLEEDQDGSGEENITDEIPDDEEGEDGGNDSISVLNRLIRNKKIMAVVYPADSYPLREEAAESAAVTGELECGTTLYLERAVYDGDSLWFYVTAYTENGVIRGYIPRAQFVCVDEDFLRWEKESGRTESEEPGLETEDGVISSEALNASALQGLSAFPDSYRVGLSKLQQKHPNWIFVPQKVGMTLEEAVKAEFSDKDRNWVYSTVDESYKGDPVPGYKNWYYANEAGLRYYMNPAGFVGSETNIFMFEQLTYNESYHTINGVQSVLKKTFMSGDIPGEDTGYSEAFWSIGSKLGVSPYHLAARVVQEQGTKGTSDLISGTFAGYEGYYNYFNIQASGKNPITNGLAYAKKQGWDTRYKSLKGGSEFDSNNYILKGQDTPYLEKFNLIKKNYSHQYMQNVTAPLTEAKNMYSMYSNSGALDNPFVFKIPVFDGDTITGTEEPEEPTEPEKPRPVVKGGTMKLSSVSLRLNTALSVSRNGMQEITAVMKNGSLPVDLGEIKGVNNAAQKLLDSGYLKTSISGDILRMGLVPENRGGIKAGVYRFNVTGTAKESELVSYKFKEVRITVKIVDKAPEKLFVFRAKGSVNLVDREDKYIIYTPKITDLGSNKLKAAEITGDAGELFEAELFEKDSVLPDGKTVTAAQGVILLRAKSGVSMNRARTYPVTIVSTLDNDLRIEKTVKVKPVQTPAKTTAKLSADFIPRDGQPVTLTVKNAGKTEFDSVIESVELVSEKQGRFFEFEPSGASDDPHVFTGELRANENILRTGKYTLKFNVRFRGHGENVKPYVITMNVRVNDSSLSS